MLHATLRSARDFLAVVFPTVFFATHAELMDGQALESRGPNGKWTEHPD